MRAGTSSRTLTILILLAFAMVALGQLTKEQPAQASSGQNTEGQQSQNQAQPNSATPHQPSASSSGPQNANGGAQNPNAPTASGLSIRGCLMQGKEGYVLQQESTDATFQLLGSDAQLAGASHKLVEVRGSELEPVQASINMPRLQVSEVKVVADQCPVTSKVALPNSGAPAGERNPEPDATPRYERDNPVQAPPAVGTNPNTPGTSGAPSAGTGNPPPAKPPA
jgi:hypothetical protein